MGYAIAGVVVVVAIVCAGAILLADRVMDAILGGSYRLVQSATARRGRPFHAALLTLTIAIAVGVAILGTWVYAH